MPPSFPLPPPTSLLLKRFRFLLLSKLVLRPPWQHDEMCLPHLFSFKTVVYENNVCSKRDGKSKQFAILIFLVQKFYLIKLRLPICVGVNICFKFPVSSTLPPHIIYSLANSDNIFLHFLTYSTPCCCPNNHLVSIRLDFSLSALAGNEDRRKGWLQLTLPICTLTHPHPPSPTLSPFLYKIYFQSDLAGFRILDGWTWKLEFISFEIPAQRLYFELSMTGKSEHLREAIPVNNMVGN